MKKTVICKKSNYNISIPISEEKYLIYNSLSNGFSLLNQQEYTLLEDQNQLAFDPEDQFAPNDFFKTLLEHGFIVPQEIDELNLIEEYYQQARNSDEILTLTIAPTIGCNFACDYCFQEHDNKSGMSEEVQEKIYEFVTYVADHRPHQLKHLHVCFYGGEPLLKMNIVKNLASWFIQFCDSRNINYTSDIVTNGFLLNSKTAKELYEHRVTQCQVTLDGNQKMHDARRHLLSKRGTFDKIISNIVSYIDEVPIFTNIRVNIDKRNVSEVHDLIEYLSSINLNNRENLKIYFAPVESTTSACKEVEMFALEKNEMAQSIFELYALAVEKGLHTIVMPPRMMGLCTAVKKNGFVIAPNGDCHKCWDIITYSKLRIGTIFDFKELLDKQFNHEHRKWHDFSPFKNEVCRDCKILPNCVSSCAYKFIYSADVNGISVLPCPDWKFNIKKKLAFVALKLGIISELDYEKATLSTNRTELSLSSKFHTVESMTNFPSKNSLRVIS
ncbi:MAG: SPASM domain-containing protein [Candidatus Protochlamydia sp.]|nr:SPASM domain-containing protein [Candidatus Protochlamydia sp.]